MVFVPPCGLACQIKPRNDSIAQIDARVALGLTPTVYDTPWVNVMKDSRLPELPPIDRDDIPQPASIPRHLDRLGRLSILRIDDVAGTASHLSARLRLRLRIQSAAVDSLTFGIAQVTASTVRGAQLTPPRTQCTCQQLSRNLGTFQTIVTRSIYTSGFKWTLHASSLPCGVQDDFAISHRLYLLYLHLHLTLTPTPAIRARLVELSSDAAMMST
jgi:hypothetical protein